MSTVLEEKLCSSNQTFSRESAFEKRSLIRSILLSALLLSSISSVGFLATHSIGSFEVNDATAVTLSAIGAAVCFTSLPLLVALYRKKQQLALLAASFLVFSMVVLAGVIS